MSFFGFFDIDDFQVQRLLKYLFVIVLFSQSDTYAQRSVSFLPYTPGGRLGYFIGLNPTANLLANESWELSLPGEKHNIHWRLSPIKQYGKIFTGSEELPSQANVWEGVDDLSGNIFFTAVTIGDRIYSLSWRQGLGFGRIVVTPDGIYELSREEMSDWPLEALCNYLPLPGDFQLEKNSRQMYSSCQLVEFQLVTDMAVGQSASQAALAEANALEWFAMASTFFYSFDVDLDLRISSLVVPLEESPFPSPTDPAVLSFGDLNFHLKYWLEDKGISAGLYDFTVALTKFNYKTGNYVGHMFGGPPNSLGVLFVELQQSIQYTINILIHEMGHGFGAGHDAENGYIMSPLISGGSWSRKSKDEINEYLQREDIVSHFQNCPRLMLNALEEGEIVKIYWEASYEYNTSHYLLQINDAPPDTIKATGEGTEFVRYEVVDPGPLEGLNYYKVSQYSIFGELTEFSNVALDLSGKETTEGTGYGPNPFDEQLRVKVGEGVSGITVYDVAGRIHYQVPVVTSPFEVQTGSWQTGVYFLRIGEETYRVIKQ